MTPKCALIILDGFGITAQKTGNAVLSANLPYFRNIVETYPKTLLKASGQEVGLPWGIFGNSEVGHTNIGLGRVVLQDLPQIDKVIESHVLSTKPAILNVKKRLVSGGKVHIIGILSDGGVHGHINHIIALANEFYPAKVVIHAISDGRDVAEKSVLNFIAILKKSVSNNTSFGSVSGRYYAMDRDKNFDRIKLAYMAIRGIGKRSADTIDQAVEDNYSENLTDEFFKPTVIGAEKMDVENDIIIFANYRADRALELTRSFVEPNDFLPDEPIAKNFISMTTYDDNLPVDVLFSNLELNDPQTNPLTNPLVEMISKSGFTQLHIAETEKYAHITYFFSGGVTGEFPGQENVVVPSEKVRSYDVVPQMSARKITDELIERSKKDFNFIVANYANPDMVGHSGKMEAAVKAVEFVDKCLNILVPKLLENGYEVILTADHGNCDEMIDLKSGKPNKEHSLNPVPFIYLTAGNKGSFQGFDDFVSSEPIGVLADIAPSICSTLGLKQGDQMIGLNLKKSLI